MNDAESLNKITGSSSDMEQMDVLSIKAEVLFLAKDENRRAQEEFISSCTARTR